MSEWRAQKDSTTYPDLIWDDTPDGKQHLVAEVHIRGVADQIVADHNRAAALESENAALREALTKIAGWDITSNAQWSASAEQMQRMARAALARPSRAGAEGGIKAQRRCPHGHEGCCGHHNIEDMPIHVVCPEDIDHANAR